MDYTNAQFRSILNGLGYGDTLSSDPNFPISSDNSPLDDYYTIEGIKAFQVYFKLTVDGIAGPITMAKAAQAMRILQAELNQVVDAGLPANTPFYGPRTTEAVKLFQSRFGFLVNGVASLPVRQKLYALSQQPIGC